MARITVVRPDPMLACVELDAATGVLKVSKHNACQSAEGSFKEFTIKRGNRLVGVEETTFKII